jgi:predicted RNA-binding protein with RPS1 domain
VDGSGHHQPPIERVEPEGGTDPADAVAVRLALIDALRALPEHQRQVVALRHLAGLSQVQVARALGVRPGTVAQHVHRGMAALRLALGEPGTQIEPDKENPMKPPFEITVGDRRRGRVHAIVPFGAFVEIDGRHGLLHRDELGETALEVGQQVDVVVLAVERRARALLAAAGRSGLARRRQAAEAMRPSRPPKRPSSCGTGRPERSRTQARKGAGSRERRSRTGEPRIRVAESRPHVRATLAT